MSESQWEAVVKAPQGGPVYTHHFEGSDPGDLLRHIADALDLSRADGVQVSMARAVGVGGRTSGLSPTQEAALRLMPVPLTHEGCLPPWSPSGATVKALERRGLVERDGRRWKTTPAGEAVLAVIRP